MYSGYQKGGWGKEGSWGKEGGGGKGKEGGGKSAETDSLNQGQESGGWGGGGFGKGGGKEGMDAGFGKGGGGWGGKEGGGKEGGYGKGDGGWGMPAKGKDMGKGMKGKDSVMLAMEGMDAGAWGKGGGGGGPYGMKGKCGGCGMEGGMEGGPYGMKGAFMKGGYGKEGYGGGAGGCKGGCGVWGGPAAGGAKGMPGMPVAALGAAARPAPAVAKAPKKPAEMRLPQCVWICAPNEEKVPPVEAPCIVHDKTCDIFSSSSHVLQDVVGNQSAAVKIVHDPEWEVYPEVGKAVTDALGEENCVSVGFFEPKGVWAVGVAAGTQGRERAVKLALAVAIASEDAAVAAKAQRHYPGFWKLCEAKLGDYDPSTIPAITEQPKGVSKPGLPQMAFVVAPEQSGLAAAITAAEGCAIVHDKAHAIFSESSHILQDVVDIGAVKIVHDPDANVYGSISTACGQAFDEEHCVAVATCEAKGAWAVGCASGKVGRERAVKLALAVSIASEDPGTAAKVEKNYPGFWALCEEKLGAFDPNNIPKPLNGGAVSLAAELGTPPVHILQLGSTGAFALEGLPIEGPCITYSKENKEYFSDSHAILGEFIEDTSTIDFRDDADWKMMPEIGQAITAAGAEEISYAVAVDPTKSCWGVGISNGKKTRQPAAKLALALAMAQLSGRVEEIAKTYPEFGKMCHAAGLVELGGEPAMKKLKNEPNSLM